jgi:CHAT domain-containing protein
VWFVLAVAIVQSSPAAPSEPAARAGAEQPALRAGLEQARGLVARNENAEGLKLLQPLLARVEAAGDELLLLEAVYQTALAHHQLADYSAALPHWERALALSRSSRDRAREGETLRRIGSLHKNTGAYDRSLRALNEALAVFAALNDREGAARTLVTMGATRDLMGDYRAALDAFERARPMLEETRGPWLATLLNESALTYGNLGRYEDALAAHTRALEWRRGQQDRSGEIASLTNIGLVYDTLGLHERAIEHYEQALARCDPSEDRRAAAIALSALANSRTSLGDPRRALDPARRALELARELQLRHFEGQALHNLAQAHAQLGELPQSRECYEEALAVWRATGARGNEADTLLALADLDLRGGHPGPARLQAEQALALAQQGQSPEIEWRARYALARAARSEQRPEEALTLLRDAIGAIESLRGRVLTDTGKVGFLEERQAVYHELAELLSESDPGGALEVAEAARSRAFSDLLAGRAVASKPGDAEALAAIRDLEARLRAQTQTDAADAAARAELVATRSATERDLQQRVRDLRAAQPELASLVVAEPLTIEEIRRAARERQATLVEYLVSERRLLVWVVSPDGEVTCSTLPTGRAELRQKASRLIRQMDGIDLAALGDRRPVKAALAELHRTLLTPVSARLPRDPRALVYVVPHDALFRVPFAALVDANGRHALETHSFASVPAIGVLRYTAAKQGLVLDRGQPRLLALADPEPPHAAGVGQLPGAREEVRRIGRHFAPSRLTTLRGAEASESNSKRLGPGQTILHFAVHGMVDDGRPWDSALVLAPGGGEDGYLKVSEVFGLELRADLVVLSGCSTGRGRLSGDGILGLSRAFLYAGTPSVVVSQWDVSDLATSYLMDRFYSGLRAGRGKAEALRLAQLATLERYPHPALWAAFLLVGEAL